MSCSAAGELWLAGKLGAEDSLVLVFFDRIPDVSQSRAVACRPVGKANERGHWRVLKAGLDGRLAEAGA